MSYNKNMFHRIAEELDRIGYEVADETHEKIDEYDLSIALDALGRIVIPHDDDLALTAISIASCRFGGMYEIFQELPDIKEHMLELLLKDAGYEYMESEKHEIWVR